MPHKVFIRTVELLGENSMYAESVYERASNESSKAAEPVPPSGGGGGGIRKIELPKTGPDIGKPPVKHSDIPRSSRDRISWTDPMKTPQHQQPSDTNNSHGSQQQLNNDFHHHYHQPRPQQQQQHQQHRRSDIYRPTSDNFLAKRLSATQRHSDFYRPSLDNLVETVHQRASARLNETRGGGTTASASTDSLDNVNKTTAEDCHIPSTKSVPDISSSFQKSKHSSASRTEDGSTDKVETRSPMERGTYRALNVHSGFDFAPTAGNGKLWDRDDPVEKERKSRQRQTRVSLGQMGYRKVEFNPPDSNRRVSSYESRSPRGGAEHLSRSSPNLQQREDDTCDNPPPIPPRDTRDTVNTPATVSTGYEKDDPRHARFPSWSENQHLSSSVAGSAYAKSKRRSFQPNAYELPHERLCKSEEYEPRRSVETVMKSSPQPQYKSSVQRAVVSKVESSSNAQQPPKLGKMSDAFATAALRKEETKLMETFEKPPSDLYPRFDASSYRYQPNEAEAKISDINRLIREPSPQINPPSLESMTDTEKIEALIDEYEALNERPTSLEVASSPVHSRQSSRSSGTASPLKLATSYSVVRSPLEKPASFNLPWPPPPPLEQQEGVHGNLKIFRTTPKVCYNTSTQTENTLDSPDGKDMVFYDSDVGVHDVQTQVNHELSDVEDNVSRTIAVGTDDDSVLNSPFTESPSRSRSSYSQYSEFGQHNAIHDVRNTELLNVDFPRVRASLAGPVSHVGQTEPSNELRKSDGYQQYSMSVNRLNDTNKIQENIREKNISQSSNSISQRKQDNTFNAGDGTALRQIHDYSMSTAPMLRKLSEEFFIQQQNAAIRQRQNENLRKSCQQNVVAEEPDGNLIGCVKRNSTEDIENLRNNNTAAVEVAAEPTHLQHHRQHQQKLSEQLRFEEIELPWEKSKKLKKEKKYGKDGEKKKKTNPFDLFKSFNKKLRANSDSDKKRNSSQSSDSDFTYGAMRRTDSEKALYRKHDEAPPPGKLKRASSETFRPMKERLKSANRDEEEIPVFNRESISSPVSTKTTTPPTRETEMTRDESFRAEKRHYSDPTKENKRATSSRNEPDRRQWSDPATSGYESNETLDSIQPSMSSSRSISRQSLEPSIVVGLSKYHRRSHMDSSSSMRSEDSVGSSERSASREHLHAMKNATGAEIATTSKSRKSWDGILDSEHARIALDPAISEESGEYVGPERPRSLSTGQKPLKNQYMPRLKSPSGQRLISPKSELEALSPSPKEFHPRQSPINVQYILKDTLSPMDVHTVVKPRPEPPPVTMTPTSAPKPAESVVNNENLIQPVQKQPIQTWETRDNLSLSDESNNADQMIKTPPSSPYADVTKLSSQNSTADNNSSRMRHEERSKSVDDASAPVLPPRKYLQDEEWAETSSSNASEKSPEKGSSSYAAQLRQQAKRFSQPQQPATSSTATARTGVYRYKMLGSMPETSSVRTSAHLVQSKSESSVPSQLSVDFHHNRPLQTSSPVTTTADVDESNDSPKLVRTPERRYLETSFPASPELPLPPPPVARDGYNSSYNEDDIPLPEPPPLPADPPPSISTPTDTNSYSSESYMSNRTQRVPVGGFAGNYRRSSSSSGVPIATNVSTSIPTDNPITSRAPASHPFNNTDARNYDSGSMSTDSDDSEGRRQPVRDLAANFEKQPRRFHTPEREAAKPRNPNRSHVAVLTAKFGGSYENLTRSNESLSSSNENICDNKQTLLNAKRHVEPPPVAAKTTPSRQPLTPHRQNGSYNNGHAERTDVSTPARQMAPADTATSHNNDAATPAIVHVRQKSQEEIDCDQHAKILANELKKKDRKLSEVISPPQYHKTTKDYMGDLYNNTDNIPTRRISIGTPNSRYSVAKPENSPSHSSQLPSSPFATGTLNDDDIRQNLKDEFNTLSLDQKKEELIIRINKKLESLSEVRNSLEDDIAENNNLEKDISRLVEERCKNHRELEKYQSFVGELDKILHLLLKLSGRLARSENAVLGLPNDADPKEKASLVSKRDKLKQQLEDARKLKEGIDRREVQVSGFLKNYLNDEEFADFEHLVKMKSKITLEQQEIDDKVNVGTEQLKALKKSMSHHGDMDDIY
ncbi:uncharacterized protein LOC141906471 isoform X2 [Tubulanus polymorphus]|uniref:uncharacterized protein LOC141906471 isoform X2 n=1 Tax=Tubulanus polymorphus TaxID=672921 RepID=UPI003DA62B7E